MRILIQTKTRGWLVTFDGEQVTEHAYGPNDGVVFLTDLAKTVGIENVQIGEAPQSPCWMFFMGLLMTSGMYYVGTLLRAFFIHWRG